MEPIANSIDRWDVLVIGGGAAGLWAAGTAAQRGRRTLLVEKNRKLGVKILMSGGTRCNITHDCDARTIADAFGSGGPFLRSALARLSPADVVATIEAHGVATKVESTGKVFPTSDRAVDVRDALVERLVAAGAHVAGGNPIQGISRQGDTWHLQTSNGTVQAGSLILATGGQSYPGCGTTGEGYAWCRALGHTISAPRPALTPLVTETAWVRALSGVTLEDARLRVIPPPQANAKTKRTLSQSSRSSLLWTHWGFSGPAALNVSRAYSLPAAERAREIHIDLLPALDPEQVHAALLPTSGRGGRALSQVVREWLPRRLTDALLELLALADTPLAETSKASRERFVATLKGLVVPIHATLGFEKAEVTAGGVALDEIDARTMQSRICPGLYLAGEILDVDGPIGGYNFQAAFSTGHLAGLNA